MGMVLIIAGLLMHQGEAMLVKRYGNKYGAGGFFFNAVICAFATVYFLVSDLIVDPSGLQFNNEVLLYGGINSTMYALGFYAAYVAFRSGSFGLTRLFTSFGTILTVLYGVIVLGEKLSVVNYIAIVLLVLSVYLLNAEKDSETRQKTTLKWVVAVVLTVLSNAMIMVISKAKHSAMGNACDNEYLTVSYVGATLFLVILGVIFDRKNFGTTFKYGLLYGGGAGVFNGINNLLIMLTYSYLPISIISPVKSGLGMVLSFFISVLFYKEKFTIQQYISIGLGVVAVVLMNL